MVERRDYEIYLKNHILHLLQNTTTTTLEKVAQLMQLNKEETSEEFRKIFKEKIQNLTQRKDQLAKDISDIIIENNDNERSIIEKIHALITQYTGSTTPTDIITDIKLKKYELPSNIKPFIFKSPDNDESSNETEKLVNDYLNEKLIQYLNRKYQLYTPTFYQSLIQEVAQLPDNYTYEDIIKAPTLKRSYKEEKDAIYNVISIIRKQKENKNYNLLEFIYELYKDRIIEEIKIFINKNVDKTKKKIIRTVLENEVYKTAIIQSLKDYLDSLKPVKQYKWTLKEGTFDKCIIEKELTRILQDQSINIKTKEDRNIILEEYTEYILKNIIHVSASNPLIIRKYKTELPDNGAKIDNLAQINGILVPMDFVTELIKRMTTTIDVGMSHSYTFLSEYNILIHDEDNNKYILPNQDLHIFGLEKSEKSLPKIIQYLADKIKNKQLITIPTTDSVDTKRISMIPLGINGDISKVLLDKSESKSIEQTIQETNLLQRIISKELMPTQEEDKINLLVYFLLKDSTFITILNVSYNPFEIETIRKTLQDNVQYFGNDFVSEFTSSKSKNIYKKIITKLRNRNTLELIKNKYDGLFYVQEILEEKHQKNAIRIIEEEISKCDELSPKIINSIISKFGSETVDLKLSVLNNIYNIYKDENKTVLLFSIIKNEHGYIITHNDEEVCKITNMNPLEVKNINKKYIVDSTTYGSIQICNKTNTNVIYTFDIGETISSPKLETRKANLFGLVHVYLKDKKNNFWKLFINEDCTSFGESVNLFKVYDKLTHLTRFNYLLNLENVYINDLQNYLIQATKPKKENELQQKIAMICEISAFFERVFVFFEKKFNGITKFVSVQGISEINSIEANFSTIPSITGFDANYKTLFGFSIVSRDRIDEGFYNIHTSVLHQNKTFEDFLRKIKDNKYALRQSTARTSSSEEHKQHLLNNPTEIEFIELLDRSLKGISNTLLWLATISDEELQEFIKYSITKKDSIKFKQTLFLHVQKHLEDIVSFLSKYDKQIVAKKSVLGNYLSKLKTSTELNIANLQNIYQLSENITNMDINNSSTYEFLKEIQHKEFITLLTTIARNIPSYMMEHLLMSTEQIDNLSNENEKQFFSFIYTLIGRDTKDEIENKVNNISTSENNKKKLLYIEQKLNAINICFDIIGANYSKKNDFVSINLKLLQEQMYYTKIKKSILEEELIQLKSKPRYLNLISRIDKKIEAIASELVKLPSMNYLKKKIEITGNVTKAINAINDLLTGKKDLTEKELDEIAIILINANALNADLKGKIMELNTEISLFKLNHNPTRIESEEQKDKLDLNLDNVLQMYNEIRMELSESITDNVELNGMINEVEKTPSQLNENRDQGLSKIANQLYRLLKLIRVENSISISARILELEEEIENELKKLASSKKGTPDTSIEVTRQINDFSNLMLNKYYPSLFHVVSKNANITEDDKRKIMANIVECIKGMYEEQGIEYESYQMLLLKQQVQMSNQEIKAKIKLLNDAVQDEAEGQNNYLDDNYKEIIESRLLAYLRDIITIKKNLDKTILEEQYKSSNQLLITSDRDEVRKYILDNISCSEILKAFVSSLIKEFYVSCNRNSSLEDVLGLKRFNKDTINCFVTYLYSWLMELPYRINYELRTKIFDDKFTINNYCKFVQLSITELINNLNKQLPTPITNFVDEYHYPRIYPS